MTLERTSPAMPPASSDPRSVFAVPAADGSAPRVAILGSGPVGLDAALAALEAGCRVQVWEAADEPAAHVRDWGHVRLFSPWSMNRSARMDRALQRLGRPLQVDEAEAPLGSELVEEVLDPLWSGALPPGTLVTGHRVVAIAREGLLKHEEIGSLRRAAQPFRLLLRKGDGSEVVRWADRVVDCTGVRSHPNALGAGGIPAPGEAALGHRIGRRIPESAAAVPGRRVLVVGGGHSAQTAILRLALEADPGARPVTWAIRDPEPAFRTGADDPLPERLRLTTEAQRIVEGGHPGIRVVTGAEVNALANGAGPDGQALRVELLTGGEAVQVVEVDHVLALTGGVGDASLYRQLQVHECYATSGPMKLAAALMAQGGGAGTDGGGGAADCLSVEAPSGDTLQNPEPGFWIVGEKSYGRNSTFLLRNGWLQVDQVAAELRAGRGPAEP